MFRIEANPHLGQGAADYWSFAETAAEIGCGIGDLTRTMDELRSLGPWLTGFRAIALADCQRLIAETRKGKRGLTPTVTPRAGFGDLVDYSEAALAAGCGGIAFRDAIDRLKITVVNVICLTREGHTMALTKLAYLKDDKPPAGMNAVQIADWRQSRASIRFNAEVAALEAPAKARQRRTPDDMRRVLALVPTVQPAPDPLRGW